MALKNIVHRRRLFFSNRFFRTTLVAINKITACTTEATSKVISEFCMAILAPDEIHAKKRLDGITAGG
jgi:hypothetical protein